MDTPRHVETTRTKKPRHVVEAINQNYLATKKLPHDLKLDSVHHVETSKTKKPRHAVEVDNHNLDTKKLFHEDDNRKHENKECLVNNKKHRAQKLLFESELERTLRLEKARLKRLKEKKTSLLKACPTISLPIYSRGHGTWKSGMSTNSFPFVKVKIEPADTTIKNKVNPVEKKKSSREPKKVTIWRFSDGTVFKKN